MRGANGFVVDKAKVIDIKNGKYVLKVINPNTSMTNVALDLIIQTELAQYESTAEDANYKINHILDTLGKLSFHTPSGLFFNWYSTDESNTTISKSISSVDNLHMALALFSIKESIKDEKIQTKASSLFTRMDFSMFYDGKTGLLYGNYIFKNNQWVQEAYHYGHIGSEARILYPLGWALGLFKKFNNINNFFELALSKMQVEFFNWKTKDLPPSYIMKTWDGGGFQLFLPQLLISEDGYSNILSDSFKAYSDFIIEKGIAEKLALPAGFSASNYGDGSGGFDPIPEYNGHSGSPDLVSDFNFDFKKDQFRQYWDLVVTPHAIMMAASVAPLKYAPIMQKCEKLHDDQLSLYSNELGWLDGMHVKGKHVGRIVPILLSLDQGMIALSLIKILSKDSKTLSARALQKNTLINAKIIHFYKLLEKKMFTIQYPFTAQIP